MQTRPLLSSDPMTVEMNGWTSPVIDRNAPLSHRARAAGQSAVVQAGRSTPGMTWDIMGQDATSNKKPIFLRDLSRHLRIRPTMGCSHENKYKTRKDCVEIGKGCLNRLNTWVTAAILRGRVGRQVEE